MIITNDIKYVGVNDRELDLFESQFVVENGMAYNSYVIIDEKIAVMDSVDINFKDMWLANIFDATKGKSPDYLIVSHMEPDHSGSILSFADKYPEAKIVASAKAFGMMKNFFGCEFEDRRIVVNDKDSLNLGKHELSFTSAPMVHWPEVIVTYDNLDNVLFSADAFGKFGATDTDEDWACEARRYYFGIVGKYGAQVKNLLTKLDNLDIKTICPLHGPILKENLDYYINLYKIWSSYGTETDGVTVAYTSVYGHTKEAAEFLANKLTELGCSKVALSDLARCDMAEAVEDAFRYGKLVLATTTYNADIFPFMRIFIDNLKERNFSNKTVAFIENGSWAPIAAKKMQAMLEGLKNLSYCENTVTIHSALTDENKQQLSQLAEELCR